MPKNKLTDLRDHLFETIELLKDPDSGMDVKTAREIGNIASVIVDSARVEVEFQREVGGVGSGFIAGIGDEGDKPRLLN
jgi:hypothetical protein